MQIKAKANFNSPLHQYEHAGRGVYGEPLYRRSAVQIHPDRAESLAEARAQQKGDDLMQKIASLRTQIQNLDQTEGDFNRTIGQIVTDGRELSGSLISQDGHQALSVESGEKEFHHLVHPTPKLELEKPTFRQRVKNWFTAEPKVKFSEEFLVFDRERQEGVSLQVYRESGDWLVTDVTQNSSYFGDVDDWM